MASSLQRAVPTAPPAQAGAAGRQTAATGRRPDAGNRRTLGDIGNLVTAPALHGGAKPGEGINRRAISRRKEAQAHLSNAVMASENAVAPRPSEHRADRTGSNDSKKKPSQCAGIDSATTRTTRDVRSLTRRLAVAESELAQEKEKVRIAQQSIRKKDFLARAMKAKQWTHQELIRGKDLLIGDMTIAVAELGIRCNRLADSNDQLQNDVVQKAAELQEAKAQKEAQVLKLVEENVRLHSDVDKKEALIQALMEQLKFMALNHPN